MISYFQSTLTDYLWTVVAASRVCGNMRLRCDNCRGGTKRSQRFLTLSLLLTPFLSLFSFNFNNSRLLFNRGSSAMPNAVAENVTGTIGTVLVSPSTLSSKPLNTWISPSNHLISNVNSGAYNWYHKVRLILLAWSRVASLAHYVTFSFFNLVYLNHKRRTTEGLHVAL